LPKGDKTWVQLQKVKSDSGEASAPFVCGTLYSIIREIESKSTKVIKLTSYGEAKPVTENGLQRYEFTTPKGAENHREMDFVLSPSKPGAKVQSNNFFSPIITRAVGLGDGVLQPTWRLSHDAVNHLLRLQRVCVTNKVSITLEQGKPIKVCWPLPPTA
jgi:hypothetical protein